MPSASSALVVILTWASIASAQADFTDQGRYLRAVAIAREGKLGPASEELELLAHNGSVLADRSAYEAGLLFERRGALRKAADLYARVSEHSHFFVDAKFALARVSRFSGDLIAAAAAVAPLTSSSKRSIRRRALLELEKIAELEKDERGKRDVQIRLALAGAAWLGGAPVLAVISSSDDTLLERTTCREAQRVSRQASPALACASRLFAAEASACAGKDVSNELRRILRQCPQPEVAARGWMTLGMLQAKAGKVKASAATFREVAKVAPATPLAAEALFAAFWVGWKADPAGSSGEELVDLEALPIELSASERARVTYWRSRSAQARGDSAHAAALLAQVGALYPATWYGHLARERLTVLDLAHASTVALAVVIPAHTDDSQEQEALERLAPGITAVKLGLEDGPAELMSLARLQPSPASNRLVVEVLNAAGATGLAYRFARSVLREQAGGRQDAAVWQAAFPPHFAELLAQHADETNVVPSLLHAVVREESAFNPTAKSHCGALGLMQLMPVTARALALERGAALATLDDLFDPDRNVSLGSRYLGQLLKRFAGNRAAVAAAYNGGPTRVARWLKSANPARFEEWVEEIPLDETRNYVKDVVASADVYQHSLAAERSKFARR